MGVRVRPAVVRFEHLDGPEAGWISTSFHRTTDVEGHLSVLGRLFAADRGCGVFLVGPYGSGKTHFLSYLAQHLSAGLLDPSRPTPRVAAVSLVNFRGEVALDDVLRQALGLPDGGADRRHAWEALAESAPGGRGVVLLLDEVSEFLRAKPSRDRLNEDVRTLQFLGEWAQGRRFWLVAAMQEQVEHAGALESSLYRKIKDRFPHRLILSGGHVRGLLRDSVLVRGPGYEEAVRDLVAAARRALPEGSLDWPALLELYPIHPATLDLLEEVRDRFSQARGAVEFALTRLGGDPSRGVAPFLDRPWGDLLTPDVIVDHFADLLELQSDLLPLSQRFLPHLRQRLPELMPTEAQQELASRVLKLLVLAHLSPRRDGLTADEAAAWLLVRVTSVDPARNVAVVERILSRLASEGRFVREQNGRYRLDLADDSAERLDARLAREVSDLAAWTPESVWELLVPALGEVPFNPFSLSRDRWQQRSVRWHFHPRTYGVVLGNGDPGPHQPPALRVRLPWGDAAPSPAAVSVIPARLDLTPELVELAAMVRLQGEVLDRDLAALLERRVNERRGLLRERTVRAFLECRVEGPDLPAGPPPRPETDQPVGQWLDALACWLLARRFPSFERFAPCSGPLPKDALRRLMRVAAEHDLGDFEGDEYVKLIREAYLVPMGLMRREGWYYTAVANLDRHELVRALAPLVEHGVAPSAVYEHLAQPVYGLVPDQVDLLLVFLLLQGEVEIVKGKRSYRELFETMPRPLQYDRVEPARTLTVEQQRALEQLCDGLGVGRPRQWTAAAEKRLVQQLSRAASREQERLLGLVRELGRLEGAEALAGSVREAAARFGLLARGERPAVEQFLHDVGSPSRFLADHATLSELPERLSRLGGELRRLRHLVGHPVVRGFDEPAIAVRLEALGDPPPASDLDALEQWLAEARTAYALYRERYRERHDGFWAGLDLEDLLRWEPSPLARSRHLELGEQVGEVEALRRRLDEACCTGLSDLDFHPVCRCGFDGRTAPAVELAGRLSVLRDELDEAVRRFFGQAGVRDRLQKWAEQDVELTPGLVEYLEGRRATPEVSDLGLLDRHLAGVEVVREVDAAPLVDLLVSRTWEPGQLCLALEREIERLRAPRLRFRSQGQGTGADPAVVAWCLEQGLRRGVRLPSALPLAALAAAAREVREEWVSEAALGQLEGLGLGEEVENRVLGWLLDGRLAPPRQPSPLVVAALEVIRPTAVTAPRDLARLSSLLYRHHPRLWSVAGARWLERLETLAGSSLAAEPVDLPDILPARDDHQWLVVDGLGLPLLDLLEELLGEVPGFGVERVEFARVSRVSTTDGWLSSLAGAGVNHPLLKLNGVDRLLHEREAVFGELETLARAELELGLTRLAKGLDRARPVLVFADHGFRLDREGRRFAHGGASTLERVVPVVTLRPAR